MHNTEDKPYWVGTGEQAEGPFVEIVCPVLKLHGRRNPAKGHDPYAPDLIVDEQLADLKHQTTPFFKAGMLYALDPQYTVTLNVKDYERYSQNYPEIVIYIWVNWRELQKNINGKLYEVEPMRGVWRVSLRALREQVESGQQPIHSYQRRRNDMRGNAKDSYVFDLRGFDRLLECRSAQRMDDEWTAFEWA